MINRVESKDVACNVSKQGKDEACRVSKVSVASP